MDTIELYQKILNAIEGWECRCGCVSSNRVFDHTRYRPDETDISDGIKLRSMLCLECNKRQVVLVVCESGYQARLLRESFTG